MILPSFVDTGGASWSLTWPAPQILRTEEVRQGPRADGANSSGPRVPKLQFASFCSLFTQRRLDVLALIGTHGALVVLGD